MKKGQINPSQKEGKEQAIPSNSKQMTQGRKVVLTRGSTKRHRVVVNYIPVTEEEAKMKRAIIEDIMKKNP
jgi:hypothetical protein